MAVRPASSALNFERAAALGAVPVAVAINDAICGRDLEGVVCKRNRGTYRPAKPTTWV